MKRGIILLVLMVAAAISVRSQSCTSCTINITGLESTSYTVGPGETLCIDVTGNFTGSIMLSGGTICNRGLFTPQTFNFDAGTLDNYGNANLNGDLNLVSSRVYNNNTDAVTHLAGNLVLNGGSFLNNGVINITHDFTNTSGTSNNTGVLNCLHITGNAITNSGVINTN